MSSKDARLDKIDDRDDVLAEGINNTTRHTTESIEVTTYA